MENINLDKIIKEDELDFNMMLNVPAEIGQKLHQIIQSSFDSTANIEIIENPSDSMKIEDSRKMLFKINNEIHPITILDLPCIIEGNKTIDYKTFYKSSDISQMFYVHEDKLDNENDLISFDPFVSSIDANFDKVLWKKDKDHQYKLKHGLAKCTRNIRARRFKRKIRYNQKEYTYWEARYTAGYDPGTGKQIQRSISGKTQKEVAKKLKNIIDNGAANFESQMNKTNTDYEEDNYTNNRNENESVLNSNVKIVPPSTANKKKKNTAANNKLSISLPMSLLENNNEESHVIAVPNVVAEKDEKKKNILEEYKNLKEEYDRIKGELEKMENKPGEMIKKKKAIKKQLKALKAEYKETK